MKKRSIKWAIFLAVGIIFTIFRSCHKAKAEAWDPWSGDPWQPPEWITDGFPTDQPSPDITAEPSPGIDDQSGAKGSGNWKYPQETEEEDSRGVPSGAQQWSARYAYGSYTLSTSGTPLITKSITGLGTSSSQLNPYYWNTNQVFGNGGSYNLNTYRNMPNSGAFTGAHPVVGGGVFYDVVLGGNDLITNECNVTFTLQWTFNPTLSIGSNGQSAFDIVGASSSDALQTPVNFILKLTASDGYFEYQFFNCTLNDLANYTFEISCSDLPDDTYLSSLSVGIVFNLDWRSNPIYTRFNEFYASPDGTQYDAVYPSITYNPTGAAQFKITVKYSDDAKNRSWLKKILDFLFLPDPDAITAIITGAIADPSEGGAGLVLSMRESLLDLFEENTSQPILYLPSIKVPVGGIEYTVFNGYSFNISSFYDGVTLPSTGSGSQRPTKILEAVQFITSCLLFSAFFQSLWSMVSSIFGLHLWKGVNGEDPDESDAD